MRGESLFGDERRCLVCGTTRDLHRHHVYPGAGRREVSEREGCWVYLCGPHHNMSDRGVHLDRGFDRWLRAECQSRWEAREGLSGEAAHDEFRRLFGASYL